MSEFDTDAAPKDCHSNKQSVRLWLDADSESNTVESTLFFLTRVICRSNCGIGR